MGTTIQLKSADGFELDAYLSTPTGSPKGGLVVIQEIFGVNDHIREVVDGFAGDGYVAIAPAIFDRVEKGVELGYEGADMATGAGIARGKLQMDDTMADLQAAIEHVREFGKVGVVGYCFGGLLTWMCSANAEGISCAVGYYGGGIAGAVHLQPKVPTMLHFGDKDAHIPMTDVNRIIEAHPDVMVHVYAADHGFNCNHRASFDEAAAAEARQRTVAFFARNLQ